MFLGADGRLATKDGSKNIMVREGTELPRILHGFDMGVKPAIVRLNQSKITISERWVLLCGAGSDLSGTDGQHFVTVAALGD